MLAQLYAIRAAVDAAIIQAETSRGGQPPSDPAETCPTCGATGESQADTSTMDGVKRRKCLRCQAERVL
jgi:hypothetical protein